MNPDPRIFFASERTLLAWLRTGIAIVGLGFLVSRFGLFVHLIAAQSAHPGVAAGYPHLIGVVFVVIGSLSMVAATVQHGRFIRALPEIDRPVAYSRTWALWLAGLVSLASLALAVYLALTPE
jgi:putative membrane protein